MEVLKKGIVQVSIILLMAVLFYTIITIGISTKVQAVVIESGTNTVVVQKGDTKNLFKENANFKNNYTSSDTSIVEITNVDNNATKTIDGETVSGSRVTIKAKKAGAAVLTLTRDNGNKIYVYVAVAKTKKAYEFLSYVDTISTYMQNHSSKFSKGNPSKSTFTAAKAASSVTVNCATPAYWALNYLGLTNGSFYIDTGGSVHGLKSNSYLTKKTSGDAIGKQIQNAVSLDSEDNLLLPGDIIGNSTFTHTFIYFGVDKNGNPLVYESGGQAFSKGLSNVGCGPFTSSQYKGESSYKIKIKTILRWK